MSDRTYQKIVPVVTGNGLGKVKGLWLEHSGAASITAQDYQGNTFSTTIPNRTIVPFGVSKVTTVAGGTLYALY